MSGLLRRSARSRATATSVLAGTEQVDTHIEATSAPIVRKSTRSCLKKTVKNTENITLVPQLETTPVVLPISEQNAAGGAAESLTHESGICLTKSH